MSWLSAALGADKNDAGDPYRNSSIGYTNTALGYAPQYAGIAQQQRGIYDQFSPEMVGAIQNYGDLLGKNSTEAQRTAYINRATANAGSAYQEGESNATSDLAARGLGDSGTMAGAIIGLNNARAGAISGAANNADQYFDNLRQSNLGRLAQLYSGATQQALGNTENAMGAGAGLNEWGAGQYGNLAQMAYAAQARQQAAEQAGLGDVLGVAGTIAGVATGNPVPFNPSSAGGARGTGADTYWNPAPMTTPTDYSGYLSGLDVNSGLGQL